MMIDVVGNTCLLAVDDFSALSKGHAKIEKLKIHTGLKGQLQGFTAGETSMRIGLEHDRVTNQRQSN